MKKFYLLFFVMIVFSANAFCQQKISDVVTDPDGLPLAGVNVSLNSSRVGTVTDFNGNFEINASQKDTLIFSHVGFKIQRLVVDNQKIFTVTLKVNTESPDRMVVTALGITKTEKKIGYATQEIETDNLESVPIPSVANLFSGKVISQKQNSNKIIPML
ncbi:carboxypeptidase-like regulatory domain-containing protein [Zunongwangia sp.]|uniref:carboxypeptidase-like regulatory domain-containing protein n=1 Tax=Zunongwangia sp. TaxID=1965325 RepID=UPI003AA8E200